MTPLLQPPAESPAGQLATDVSFGGVSDWSGRTVWVERGGVQRPLPYRGEELSGGFVWGHYGYSARELARSILHEVTDSPVLAEVRCRDFAREVVAQLPADAFTFTYADVTAWLEEGRVPAFIGRPL
jgi:uncharacterized protein DUF6166